MSLLGVLGIDRYTNRLKTWVAETIASKADIDSSGKILTSQLPDYVVSGMMYGGTYNIYGGGENDMMNLSDQIRDRFNIYPTSQSAYVIIDDPSTYQGVYFIVSAADGASSCFPDLDLRSGDWIISNGSSWNKVDNTDSVTSVAGLVGNITADTLSYTLSNGTADFANPLATKAEVEEVAMEPSDWNEVKGNKGYIKNRTHFLAENDSSIFEKAVYFPKDDPYSFTHNVYYANDIPRWLYIEYHDTDNVLVENKCHWVDLKKESEYISVQTSEVGDIIVCTYTVPAYDGECTIHYKFFHKDSVSFKSLDDCFINSSIARVSDVENTYSKKPYIIYCSAGSIETTTASNLEFDASDVITAIRSGADIIISCSDSDKYKVVTSDTDGGHFVLKFNTDDIAAKISYDGDTQETTVNITKLQRELTSSDIKTINGQSILGSGNLEITAEGSSIYVCEFSYKDLTTSSSYDFTQGLVDAIVGGKIIVIAGGDETPYIPVTASVSLNAGGSYNVALQFLDPKDPYLIRIYIGDTAYMIFEEMGSVRLQKELEYLDTSAQFFGKGLYYNSTPYNETEDVLNEPRLLILYDPSVSYLPVLNAPNHNIGALKLSYLEGLSNNGTIVDVCMKPQDGTVSCTCPAKVDMNYISWEHDNLVYKVYPGEDGSYHMEIASTRGLLINEVASETVEGVVTSTITAEWNNYYTISPDVCSGLGALVINITETIPNSTILDEIMVEFTAASFSVTVPENLLWQNNTIPSFASGLTYQIHITPKTVNGTVYYLATWSAFALPITTTTTTDETV